MRVKCHAVRMARVNITVPDDLYRQARNSGLNISQLAQGAVAAELRRIAKIADWMPTWLTWTLGPTTEAERAEANTWVDGLFGPDHGQRSA